MRGALRILASAALAVLAAGPTSPARAYERTTSDATGAWLFWSLPAVPYHVNVDRLFSSPSCAATLARDAALEAVRAGFSAWRQSCADIELVYAGPLDELRTGTRGSAENLVVFRRGPCSVEVPPTDPCRVDPDGDCGAVYDCFDGDPRVVALTSVLYDPGTGRIVDADIQLNGWDGAPGPIGAVPGHGWYFTCDKPPGTVECTQYGQGGCWSMDLQNTITHEVGHVLGLAHTADPATTMYPSTDTGEISKRSLSPDDVAGVCAIYPVPSGCAAGGTGAGALSALVTLIALARARRR